jgi:hypothetical protein
MGEVIDNATTEGGVSTENSRMDATHHDMHCPKCKNENTQSIELIVKAGTQNISLTTSTAGVGVNLSGDVSIGGASSTTKGQSVSELAKELSTKFSPKRFNSAGSLIGWILFASLLPLIVWAQIRGIKFGDFISLVMAPYWWIVPIVFVVLIFMNRERLVKWSQEDKDKNKRGLELWTRWNGSGFFCHRCGHAFIPGSDEVYKPVE